MFPGQTPGYLALCLRCAESRLFSTAGSHGSQGPELRTPDAVFNGSCTSLWGGGLQGCSRDEHRENWRCARAVPALCEHAPLASLDTPPPPRSHRKPASPRVGPRRVSPAVLTTSPKGEARDTSEGSLAVPDRKRGGPLGSEGGGGADRYPHAKRCCGAAGRDGAAKRMSDARTACVAGAGAKCPLLHGPGPRVRSGRRFNL